MTMAADLDTAYPTLSERHVDALAARGRPRSVRAGEILYATGQTGFSFYVLREGELEARDGQAPDARSISRVHPGQFTGEVNMLAGRASLVTVRAVADSSLIELDADELRHAVDEIPELGDAVIQAFLSRRDLLVEGGFGRVKIIGSRFSPAAHRLRDFATRNLVPIKWVDLESDPAADAMLRDLHVSPEDTPVVLGRSGKMARNPSLAEFARCAGLTMTIEGDHVYDLVVVGAGPAGLAASVYAASEGLDVLTADQLAAGGQAGTSSRIENYLGFPAGIPGAELTRNAMVQAQRFGAKITVPCLVRALGVSGGDCVLTLGDGTKVRTRCVLVASGVSYRRLDLARFGDFEGAGIYYAATEMEARLCRGEEVIVVGGGNSAGQAVVHLSRYARRVHLVVRARDLGASMSRYLVDRIQGIDNVSIHLGAEVVQLDGDGHLGGVHIREQTGATTAVRCGSLFLFIGADANTNWLRGCVELDRHGFVLTGTSLPPGTAELERWRVAGRGPFLLETSLPGVFAAGDVRSGSIKRVASAVGEGSMAVSFVHQHIQRPM
jgi:thioredoxin reductase (NADPH)